MSSETTASGAEPGEVSFLFSHLDSSASAARTTAPDSSTVERFVALIRDAVTAHGGTLFESVAGGAYASFARPADAVAAAVDAQRELQAEGGPNGTGLSARMGIHAGPAELRDSRYVGRPLYRCARLVAAAHPGQIVLSNHARGLAGEHLPAGASLRSLGTHRLKDLAEPDQIFQLQCPGLPGDFPPLKSLESLHTNLPASMTSFVGRADALTAVKQLLGRARLVTLLGAGGTGKTRLALRVAGESLESFPQGVWLVDVAPVTEPTLVAQVVASALGIRDQPGTSLIDAIVEFVRARSALLILDNCEHLREACGAFAVTLLAGCPQARLLATSREPLGVDDEQTFLVQPLATMDPSQLPQSRHDGGAALAAAVSTLESSQLFVERARLSTPGFAITPDNAHAVAEICHQVDGIPLALELAAARVSLLSPQQLAARIGERFRVLSRGGRAALPRHQTLRAVVDWSYDLLGESERAFFNRLSVFANGWTVPAAVAIAAAPEMTAAAVLGLLEELSGKSLLVREGGRPESGAAAGGDANDDGPRYRLLATLRQYAGEKLRDGGDETTVRDRHRAWYLTLAETAAPHTRDNQQVVWLRRLVTEHDNLRAALSFSKVAGEAPGTNLEGLRIVNALSWFWFLKGFLGEGRGWIEGATASAPSGSARESHLAYARALANGGMLAAWHGDVGPAKGQLDRALALARELGDRSTMAFAQHWLGVVIKGSGDAAAAIPLHEAVIALADEEGDRWLKAFSLFIIGTLRLDAGDADTALERFQESADLFRELGDDWGLGLAITFVGEVARFGNRYEAASASFEHSLALQRRLGEKWMAAAICVNLGWVTLHHGNASRALAWFQEAINLAEEMGMTALVALGAIGGASAVAALGDAAMAATILGATVPLADGMKAFMTPSDRADLEWAQRSLRDTLGSATFDPAYEKGAQLTLEAAVSGVLAYAASPAGGEKTGSKVRPASTGPR